MEASNEVCAKNNWSPFNKSVCPDQTAPVLKYLNKNNLSQLFSADNNIRRHFQMHFVGILRVKNVHGFKVV